MFFSKIKVLQVLPALNSGGVERGTLEIAESIIKSGGQAFVASSGGTMVVDLQKMGAQHHLIPLETKSPWGIWKNVEKLKKLIQKEGIQLVHARSRAPAWSAYFACKSLGIPFVTTFHGTYGIGNSFKKHYNSVMVRGDRTIAISQFIQNHIFENYTSYLADKSAVRLVFRGADLNAFAPEKVSLEKIRSWKKSQGLSLVVPTLVMPARLTRWKGQLSVLEAFKRLKMQAQLVLVGDDQGRSSYRAELEAVVHQNNLENVHFLSHASDMSLVYGGADLVLHASTDPEAFGRVVAEAQAMGCPVLVSDLGAPKEIILEGETGWAVSPHDPELMAEKMEMILKIDPERTEKLSMAARRHIQKNFSTQTLTEKTLALYQELISS
ncbi:MAG: glycosyltransferase family 4 protein [bacterium]|nr:glycosyltransferase family 4 protein [bacterium]